LKKTDLEPAEIESIIALPRQMLHAFRIGFIHPLTGDEMHFETPLPEDFEDVLRMLRGS
jgi:23S rRNA pseudouridine1911/1915/1917 synthase